MPTIDATAGGASANSFVLETEQIAYMADRLNNSTWTTVTGSTLTADENKALIEATREINRLGFAGKRATTTQALAWPRQLAVNPDSPNADYFGTTTIPQRVKNATMELAFQFIKSGSIDVAALPSSDGVKREKIDVLETEYFSWGKKTGLAQYPRVWGELRPLMAVSSNGINAPLIRG